METASIASAAAPTLVQGLRAHIEARTGSPVTLKETHISWLLLADRLAYKLKKPVRLPFLDFSTVQARRHFCEEELRLNRRLAPALYLQVLPVCGSVQAPRLGGIDTPIDWVVCMRRFPDGALLGEQLAAGRLQPAQLDRFAQRLADFHRDAPPAAEGAPHGTPQQIASAVFAVLEQLESRVAPERTVPLRAWLEEQARALDGTWVQRRGDGCVRECHGDLHLDNVVDMDGELLAFDCIEFDPALRWIDVMSDVAFLTMDLKAHGRADLAFGFLDTYLQRGGDHAGVAVLRFYEVYRAMVRALVAQLQQDAGATRPDYLACALALTRTVHTPRLLITHGLSGAGKSTVARALLQATGAVRLRSDVERKRLYGIAALQRTRGQGGELYGALATQRTYEALATSAVRLLRAGCAVIVDAAFLRESERSRFRALAAALDVPFAILDCHAAEHVLRRRVAARAAAGADPSDADLRVLERQLQSSEPLAEDERRQAIEVCTDAEVDIQALALAWLGATSPAAAGAGFCGG